jgi:cytoskeleton protein RodZ
MADIGAQLREARMRQKIDISEVEAQTKIRAKYLRALENEEWNLLPGPTFVKTFLRTYSEFLGLDARLLVEEYKQRFERPAPHEIMPFGGAGLGDRRARRPRTPVVSPFVIVGVCILALLGALFALGTLWDDDDEPGPNRVATTPDVTPTPTPQRRRSTRRAAAAPRRVSLRIVPTGVVNVCLVDGTGKVLIRSQTLQPGDSTRTFRARRFRVTFGNGGARFVVAGKSRDVPDRQDPVGYDIRPGRTPRELAADRRPTCT